MMNTPELPDAPAARLPFVSLEARRATLSLLEAVGAFESGPKGEWNFVNHRLCEMLQVPASSLLGREWIKMIHPDDVQRAVAEYKQARDSGRTWHHELRFRRYDGSELPVLVEANPLPRDPDAAGVSYLGVISDMSAQKRAESVAEEARVALRTMVDAIDEGVIVHRNGWIILANDFAARLLGYAGWSDLIGKSGSEFVVPEDYAPLVEATESGVAAENIATFRRKDGSLVRLSVRGKPVMFAGAPARASILLPLDSPQLAQLTSARLQAQVDALEMRLALPHSRVALRDGVPTLIAANQAYADMVGRPLAEIPGLPMDVVAPRELNTKQWESYEEMVASGNRRVVFDITYRLPDGSTRPGRVYAVDYRDPVTNDPYSMSFVVPL